MSLTHGKECEACQGTGQNKWTGFTCEECNGKGEK